MTYLPQQAAPPPKRPSSAKLVLVFATQIITGTALFLLVAVVAVLLNLAAHSLEAHLEVDSIILTILHALEILILCVDAGLFVLYLLAEAVSLGRALIRQMQP